jgi:hypothetical protein
MLTAASGEVTMLVEEQARRRADERPSEAELQAIAKAEFQNQLARYCDMQREHPHHRGCTARRMSHTRITTSG